MWYVGDLNLREEIQEYDGNSEDSKVMGSSEQERIERGIRDLWWYLNQEDYQKDKHDQILFSLNLTFDDPRQTSHCLLSEW